MCGLFGAIRVVGPEHAATVVDVVLALGVLSEERGTDSAGLAMVAADTLRREASEPTAQHTQATTTGIDGTFIVKDTGRFRDLPLGPFRDVMDTLPTVFLGHTRWATQGKTDDLANISPLYAGALIGTHNGDVSPTSVPSHRALTREALGETDSELVFRALSRARNDRRALTRVLRTIHGRAALALFDRSRPDRMYLARTAVAPLAYAYDQHGNFYYASNPNWFRKIAKALTDVTFTEIALIPEGHLFTVSTLTGDIEDIRRFTPTARERDIRMMNVVAYRGFTAEDKALDLTLHRHHVLYPPLQSWPVPTLVDPVLDTPAEASAAAPSSGRASEPANRTTGTALPDAGAHAQPRTPLNDRLSAEEPNVWDKTDDGYDSAVDDLYSRIDWDDVETMCITDGHFDNDRFMDILTAPERDALDMIDALRRERTGETLPTAV